MVAAFMPLPIQQVFDDAGVPLAGGKIYCYEPGTFNKVNTWQDPDQNILNPNPIPLDGGGHAGIYATGKIRMIVNDKDDNTIWDHVGRVLQDTTTTIANAGALIRVHFYSGQTGNQVQGTHNVDPRTTKVRIKMWGGGGSGGAGSAGINGHYYGGGGGGAGSFLELWRFNITPNTGFGFAFTFTAGGQISPFETVGNKGGDTYLADNRISEIIATAGGGGGGGSGPNNTAGGGGGHGSIISNGSVYGLIFDGENGGDGWNNGTNASGVGYGGAGGSSTLGGAGRAGIGSTGGQGGSSATSYGSGGGGAYLSTSTGGAGSPGAIWFEEYADETISGGGGSGSVTTLTNLEVTGNMHAAGNALFDHFQATQAYVADTLGVQNQLNVAGNLSVNGTTVTGNTIINGTFTTDASSIFNGNVVMQAHLQTFNTMIAHAGITASGSSPNSFSNLTVDALTVTGTLNYAGSGTGINNNVVGNFTATGAITGNGGLTAASGEVVGLTAGATGAGGQFRAVAGNKSVMFRNDGQNFYLLTSDSSFGSWNNARPFFYSLNTGAVTIGGSYEPILLGGPVNVPWYNGALSVSPTGNPTINGLVSDTRSALNVQGITQHDNLREVLVNIGLESTKGAVGNQPGQLAGAADKVGLYVGVEALNGSSGNLWAANFLCNVVGNDVIGEGLEIDINNLSNDRTDNFAHPIWGLQISGAGSAPCTAAIAVLGTTNQWPYGIYSGPSVPGGGPIAISLIEDRNGNAGSSVIRTNYSNPFVQRFAGLDFQRTHFAAGALVLCAGTNTGNINWTNQSWTVGDWVDSSRNRSIGSGSAAVFVGGAAGLFPSTDGQQHLGNGGARWADVWSTNGVIQTSDVTLKDNVQPLAPMLGVVNDVDPISFSWKDGARTHYGFSAQAIKQTFDKHGLGDFAGYVEADGVKSIRPNELIPVLWQAVRELSEEVQKLKQG